MLGFTINTDILMIATGISDKETNKLKSDCVSLLQWMKSTPGAKLVIDKTAKIPSEYKSKLKSGCFGAQFVKEMATANKIELVDRATGDDWNKAQQELKIHDGDHDFLRAAMASTHKILVAEESHFCDRAKKIRKLTGVTVDNADDAVARTTQV